MAKTVRNRLAVLLVVLVGVLLAGCATGRYTVPAEAPVVRAQPESAIVVFMRPSTGGRAISSAVFDISEGQQELIAIIGPKEKIAYRVKPGTRQFMVVSEAADFCDAELAAGKTYYVSVTPRMGWMKARFSLVPFKKGHEDRDYDIASKDLKRWLKRCDYVTKTPDADAWAKSHEGNITSKKHNYLLKWNDMLEKDKMWRRLLPEDGVDEPVL